MTDITGSSPEDDAPVPFGVFAASGRPLPPLAPGALDALAAVEAQRTQERALTAKRMKDAERVTFGVTEVDDANDLGETGWAVLFAADADPDIKAALAPLLAHRQQAAGNLFRVFDGDEGYRKGESATAWLERHNVSFNPVSPTMGVPYYLLLAGSPQEIPLEFQYALDIYWAVGRIHFDDRQAYERYARSVVAYETAASVSQSREVVLFATSHDFDKATQLFANTVATPLAFGDGQRGAVGQKQHFACTPFIGASASKAALGSVLRGAPRAPALLVTGTHGMVLPPDDPRLADVQGALVCSDWKAYGSITPDHWFAAADVPADARINGLIHFCFACYSSGCPEFDNFENPPKKIAPESVFARLPQALLGHPQGGALATIGHVDRAWAYSFRTTRAPQLQAFRSVLNPLLAGQRVGQAMDQFNVRWAALSTELADALRVGVDEPQRRQLSSLWIARDDARNYIVFGDPAVRLRVDEIAST